MKANENENVISVNFEINATEIEIVKNEISRKSFKTLPENEKVEVLQRIIETRKAINSLNKGEKVACYLSIYNNGKKEFQLGEKFQLNGQIVTLQKAEITGSNNFALINKGTLKLKISGLSFVTEIGTLKAKTFAELLPVPEKVK